MRRFYVHLEVHFWPLSRHFRLLSANYINSVVWYALVSPDRILKTGQLIPVAFKGSIFVRPSLHFLRQIYSIAQIPASVPQFISVHSGTDNIRRYPLNASSFVEVKLFELDILFADQTLRSSRSTWILVLEDLFVREIVLTEFAVDRSSFTDRLVHFPLFLLKRQGAVFTLLFGVKLFLNVQQ